LIGAFLWLAGNGLAAVVIVLWLLDSRRPMGLPLLLLGASCLTWFAWARGRPWW
jgi:hypothetical protein